MTMVEMISCETDFVHKFSAIFLFCFFGKIAGHLHDNVGRRTSGQINGNAPPKAGQLAATLIKY